MSPVRNTVLTSIWCSLRSICTTKVIIVLKESFDETREKVFIIDAFFLCEALSNKTYLVLLHITLRIPLGLKYPFATNGLHTFRQWDKIPYVIVLHELNIFIYGINPLLRVGTFHGLMEVDQIVFHRSNVNLMFLEKYNVIICNYILFSLVELLNGINFWDCRVCSSKTTCWTWAGGSMTLSWSKVVFLNSVRYRILILIIVNNNWKNINVFLSKDKVLNPFSPCKLNILKELGITYVKNWLSYGIIKFVTPGPLGISNKIAIDGPWVQFLFISCFSSCPWK